MSGTFITFNLYYNCILIFVCSLDVNEILLHTYFHACISENTLKILIEEVPKFEVNSDNNSIPYSKPF